MALYERWNVKCKKCIKCYQKCKRVKRMQWVGLKGGLEVITNHKIYKNECKVEPKQWRKGRDTFWKKFGNILCCYSDWFFSFIVGSRSCTAMYSLETMYILYIWIAKWIIFLLALVWIYFMKTWISYGHFGENRYLQIWDSLNTVMLQRVVRTYFEK